MTSGVGMTSRVSFCSALLIFTFILAFLSGIAYAQDVKNSGSGRSILLDNPSSLKNLKSLSLLDPNRFTMKQQYTMNFSSSSGNGSLMGMYINSMEYRFNCPLIMRLQVAYQSQTGALFGNSNAYSGNPDLDSGRLFIPSFDLEYQLSQKTAISFHFRDYSSFSPFSNFGGFGRGRYGYSPFMMW